MPAAVTAAPILDGTPFDVVGPLLASHMPPGSISEQIVVNDVQSLELEDVETSTIALMHATRWLVLAHHSQVSLVT